MSLKSKKELSSLHSVNSPNLFLGERNDDWRTSSLRGTFKESFIVGAERRIWILLCGPDIPPNGEWNIDQLFFLFLPFPKQGSSLLTPHLLMPVKSHHFKIVVVASSSISLIINNDTNVFIWLIAQWWKREKKYKPVHAKKTPFVASAFFDRGEIF